MNVETRQLRYFVAVAQHLHFGRAAASLHLAQPALSRAIRALEAELGVELLHRTTRRVSLTPAGEVFHTRARDVLAHLDRAVDDARRIGSGLSGRLVLGAVGSASYSLLPELARRLRGAHPGLEVDVRGEMLTGDQVAALQDGSIDLALLRDPGPDTGLELREIRTDVLMLAVPTGHRLTTVARVRMADLAGETLLSHPGGRSALHARVRPLLRSVPLAATQEVQETSTLLTFVAAGLGVAVLPEPARALGISGISWCPVTELAPEPLLLGWSASAAPSVHRALATLQDLLEA